MASLKEAFAQQATALSESNIRIQSLKSQLDIKDGKASTRGTKVSAEGNSEKKGNWSRNWKRYRQIRNTRKQNEGKAVKEKMSLREELISWGIAGALIGAYYLISWLVNVVSKLWHQ
ncbi:MAG: hypothetical protein EOO61_11040 [Hymenobacter sp.]|nr:MAG: hypothetical protein EOO61_11040 [Hymenobacter sp.]